jgi:hypothetical protein
MCNDRKSEADDVERVALEGWAAGESAPPSLRDRTLHAARDRGLVGETRMSMTKVWTGIGAAAALTFVLGFGLGSQRAGRAGEETVKRGTTAMPGVETAAPAPAAAAGNRYVLFLFEDENYRPAAPGLEKQRVVEYGNWARSLGKEGRFVDGEKLADEGRWCRLEDSKPTASPPLADAKRGVLVGYFIIGAASLDEAMALAWSCPHLSYGGTLEVRRIET